MSNKFDSNIICSINDKYDTLYTETKIGAIYIVHKYTAEYLFRFIVY